uniref:ATP synthase complex subunit 8 n=1 Tax=Russelliana solanicola TaxID=2008469 RepID=A0A344A2R3_9HEMI|nr:ATP synthase F0 subunit 8 [Russelliana solanicola]AWU49054.1 ATP synthase F0 subunit 8 [Russelliana solanicola]
MPQMAPMPWMLLMFMTLIILMIIISMIYFYPTSFMHKYSHNASNFYCIKW